MGLQAVLNTASSTHAVIFAVSTTSVSPSESVALAIFSSAPFVVMLISAGGDYLWDCRQS